MSINYSLIIDCFYYNSDYKLVICEECKYAINKNNILNHLRKMHYNTIYNKLNKEERDIYISKFDIYIINSINIIPHPRPIIENFEYLRIYTGYTCKICDYSQINKQGIQKHLNKSHNISLKGVNINDYIYSNIHLQTFFTQKRDIKYFIIDDKNNRQIYQKNTENTENTQKDDDLYYATTDDDAENPQNTTQNAKKIQNIIEKYQKKYDIYTELNTQDESVDNKNKELNALLRRYNISEYIASHNKLNLKGLIYKPLIAAEKELYIIYNYIIKIQNYYDDFIFNKIQEKLLMIINDATYKKVNNINMAPFKSYQSKEAKQRNYREMANIYIYLFNYSKLNIDHTQYSPKLDSTIIGKIHSIYRLVKNNSLSDIEDQLTTEIIDLFICLFQLNTSQINLEFNKYENPIFAYFITANYNFEKNIFKPITSFHKTTSNIIYNIKFWSLIYLYTTYKDTEITEDFHIYFENYCSKFLTNKSDNIYADINIIRPYLTKIDKNLPGKSHIIDLKNGIIKFDTLELDIQKFKYIIRNIIIESRDLLFNRLLFISSDDATELINIDNMKDNITEEKPGFYFADFESKNYNYSYLKSYLITALHTPGTELNSFLIESNGRIPKFNRANLESYLNSRKKLLDNILLLIYFCNGSPLRGTEIPLILIKNKSNNIRSIFFDEANKIISINLLYSKLTAANKNESYNLRFLAPDISKILIYYLIIIYPFYLYLKIESANINEDNTSILKNTDYLFEYNGKIITSDKFSNLLKDITFQNLQFNITLHPFRHILKYIIKTYIEPKYKDSSDISDDDSDRIADLNANHSTTRHNLTYGRINTTFSNLRTDSQENTFIFCRKIHEFYLKETENVDILIDIRKENSTQIIDISDENSEFNISEDELNLFENQAIISNKSSSSRKSPPFTSAKNPHTTSAKISTTSAKTPTILDDANRQKKHIRGQSSINTNITLNYKRIKIDEIADKINYPLNLLSILRRFFNDKNADFRSKEQELGLVSIFDNISNIIYINGTNSGKSLLFLLPAFIDKSVINIILVPSVILKNNFIDECTKYKLKANIFETSANIDSNIIFISVESIFNQSFIDYINNLDIYSIKYRIYIDEVHALITQENFRYMFKYVGQILEFKPPQLILLTATMPEALKDLLYNKFHLHSTNSTLIRGDINRQNIKYSKYLIDEKDDSFETLLNYYNNRILHNVENIDNYKIIIFIKNINLIEYYASEFRNNNIMATAYHNKLSTEIKNDNIRRFEDIKGEYNNIYNILICSPALNYGYNNPNIQYTIHIEKQYDFIDFSQESGRSGRFNLNNIDATAFSIFFYKSNHYPTPNSTYDSTDLWQILNFYNYKYLYNYINEKSCLRRPTNRFLNLKISDNCDEYRIKCQICAERSQISDIQYTEEISQGHIMEKRRNSLIAKLEKMENYCFYCINNQIQGDKKHAIFQCPNKERNSELNSNIRNLNKRFRDNAKAGYGCFNCYLPVIICQKMNYYGRCELVFKDLIWLILFRVITLLIREKDENNPLFQRMDLKLWAFPNAAYRIIIAHFFEPIKYLETDALLFIKLIDINYDMVKDLENIEEDAKWPYFRLSKIREKN